MHFPKIQVDGLVEPICGLDAALGPQIDGRVDHRRFRHQQIYVCFGLRLHRDENVLVPYRRIAMRQLGHAGVVQPLFDAPQHRLDRAARQLPRHC
jgi:hypothetical protein